MYHSPTLEDMQYSIVWRIYMNGTQTRMTRQRAIILEELRKVNTHPTADEIYTLVRNRLPRISLGTVYRNLEFLTERGEILKIDAPGNTKRYDGDISWHQHVRCVRCGKIGDIMSPLRAPDTIDLYVDGFSITAARVEYDGICDDCAKKH